MTTTPKVPSYHPATHILIQGLKGLPGGSAVLSEWDAARAKVDAAHGASECGTCEGRGWMPVAIRQCETCKGADGESGAAQ